MFLDDFGRVAGGNGVGRNILCDNGVGCDDGIVGHLKLHPHEYTDWRSTTKGEVKVRLPAGRHVLTLLLFGQFNFSDFDVELR